MLPLSTCATYGCYLMQGHYTCLGTKETLSEMLGMMDKSPSTRMKEHDERNRRKATGPGHPAPPASPDIRHQPGNPAPITERPEAGSRQPGHPAQRLDIQRLGKARTSGPSPGHPAPDLPACSPWAEAHVPIRPVDYIYSSPHSV